MIEFLMVSGAPKPVAPFSHATSAEGWLFVTGQIPTDPDDDAAPLPEGTKAQTRRVIDNLQRLPARTCIGVTGLARGALVEIDLLACKTG